MQRSPTTFLLFFGVVTLVVGGVHYYLWHRLVRSPELGPGWQRWGGVLFTALALSMPLGIWIGRQLPPPARAALSWVVFLWMGFATLLFFVLLGSEIVRGGVHAVTAALARPLDPSRRTVLSRGIAGAASLLALALAGAGAASALGEVAYRNVRVALRRLPKSLSGFRVAQLTDLHLGGTGLDGPWLRAIVDRVNALAPDLVVITGDLVDGSVAALGPAVASLADLRAKHGVFFVTGNHEYYSGADAWIAELERLGVRVLRNERVSIGEGAESFDLAGVDDWSARGNGHGANLASALEGRDPARELVLLAHQPKQIVEAAEHGVGLQISGHTHGGQIFPWGFFVRIDQPYIAGLDKHGDTQIYVSRGTGFWGPPMRVAAPSEIAVIELVATA